MNSKTLLLAALMTAYGLGVAGAAGAADARGEAVQQGLAAQAEPAQGSGHVARTTDHTQAAPGDRPSSTQAPARALNQDVYYPPYTSEHDSIDHNQP